MKQSRSRKALEDITNSDSKRSRSDQSTHARTSVANDGKSIAKKQGVDSNDNPDIESDTEDEDDTNTDSKDDDLDTDISLGYGQATRAHTKEIWSLGETYFSDFESPILEASPNQDRDSVLSTSEQKRLEYLCKALEFVCIRSKRRHTSKERLEKIKQLQLPQLIIKRSTPLLGRLLDTIMDRSDFCVSQTDVKQHLGIEDDSRSDRVLDGVYARFGIGSAREGEQLFGSTIQTLIHPDDASGYTPSFLYIGESNNMRLRSVTHDVHSISSSACLHHQLCRQVKAVIQLPLLVFQKEDMINGHDGTESRKVCEAILIAALGTYYDQDTYDRAHSEYGLLRFEQMQGVNGIQTYIPTQARSIAKNTAQWNPTLMPLLGKVSYAFMQRSFCEQALLGQNPNEQASIVKRERLAQRQEDLQRAHKAFLLEKGRLLTSGKFVCYAQVRYDRGYKTLHLNNLFDAIVSNASLQILIDQGIAKEITSDRFIFKLHLLDVTPSDSDYYARSSPDVYEIMKGIQLSAIKSLDENQTEETKRFAVDLLAHRGGPRDIWSIKDKTTRSAKMVHLFLDSVSSGDKRRTSLDEIKEPSWKLNSDAIEKLSKAQVALLKGMGSITAQNRFFRGQQQRRADLTVGIGSTALGLINYPLESFVESNPWFDHDSRTFLRVNLDKESDNELQLSERHNGFTSTQIPFTLEAWSRKQDWIPVKIKNKGGKNIVKELIGLAEAYKIPLKAKSVTVTLPSTPSDAPEWINYEVRTVMKDRRLGSLGFYLSLTHRLQGTIGSGSYIISLSRNLTDDLQLQVNAQVYVFIDFWTYDLPEDYRVLISTTRNSSSWFSVPFPATLRRDLHAYRVRQLS